jgi:uncharacterized membrane-anchored protein
MKECYGIKVNVWNVGLIGLILIQIVKVEEVINVIVINIFGFLIRELIRRKKNNLGKLGNWGLQME